jgi:hypothetical protein
MKLWANGYVDFEAVDQGLIKFSLSGRNWKKWEYNYTVHQLFIDFMKAYDWLSGKNYTIN